MANSRKQHRVVIVGAGFAGFNTARELSRLAMPLRRSNQDEGSRRETDRRTRARSAARALLRGYRR